MQPVKASFKMISSLQLEELPIINQVADGVGGERGGGG